MKKTKKSNASRRLYKYLLSNLGRCGLLAPALLVLNGNPETVYINLIGLIYIFILIFILKWKRK
jgi:hypothetical protein